MTCPECNEKNNPEASFCVRCGARLKKYCTSCGAEVDGLNFCGSCGASVSGSKPSTPKVSDLRLPDLVSYRARWYLLVLALIWVWALVPRGDLPDLVRVYVIPAFLLVYIVAVVAGNKLSLSKLVGNFTPQIGWGEVVIVSIAWVVFAAGTLSVFPGIIDSPETKLRILESQYHLFIALVILAPFFEEIIFRGLLLNRLSSKYGAAPGLFMSSLVFTASHIFTTTIFMWPAQFIFGILAGFMYLRSRSLVVSMSSHSLVNFCNFLILIMFMGDQLDLQYGIVALVISTPVLVFYIVRWWPKIRVNDVPV